MTAGAGPPPGAGFGRAPSAVSSGMAVDGAIPDPNAVLGVYLTFPDRVHAEAIATALVDAGLAACVNLWPGATSVYRWEGRTVTEAEVVGWAKTTAARLPALLAAVRDRHPYEVPCAVAYPAAGGLAPYLGWVRAETAGSDERAGRAEPARPASGADA